MLRLRAQHFVAQLFFVLLARLVIAVAVNARGCLAVAPYLPLLPGYVAFYCYRVVLAALILVTLAVDCCYAVAGCVLPRVAALPVAAPPYVDYCGLRLRYVLLRCPCALPYVCVACGYCVVPARYALRIALRLLITFRVPFCSAALRAVDYPLIPLYPFYLAVGDCVTRSLLPRSVVDLPVTPLPRVLARAARCNVRVALPPLRCLRWLIARRVRVCALPYVDVATVRCCVYARLVGWFFASAAFTHSGSLPRALCVTFPVGSSSPVALWRLAAAAPLPGLFPSSVFSSVAVAAFALRCLAGWRARLLPLYRALPYFAAFRATLTLPFG